MTEISTESILYDIFTETIKTLPAVPQLHKNDDGDYKYAEEYQYRIFRLSNSDNLLMISESTANEINFNQFAKMISSITGPVIDHISGLIDVESIESYGNDVRNFEAQVLQFQEQLSDISGSIETIKSSIIKDVDERIINATTKLHDSVMSLKEDMDSKIGIKDIKQYIPSNPTAIDVKATVEKEIAQHMEKMINDAKEYIDGQLNDIKIPVDQTPTKKLSLSQLIVLKEANYTVDEIEQLVEKGLV
jgi:hypothetical protein